MKKILLILTIILASVAKAHCQPNLIVSSGVGVKDSTTNSKLITTLAAFLDNIDRDNPNDALIAPKDKVQTQDLMDEIRGIQKSRKYKNDHFYKPYLTNIVQRTDTTFLIQFSYIGVADSSAILRASFNFIGYLSHTDGCSFGSPITSNTQYWKTKKMGMINFHYRDALDITGANKFSSYISLYNQKLGNHPQIEYYICNDATDALQLLGVTYKSDYNGRTMLTLSSSYMNISVMVASNEKGHIAFDPHDLWHACLHKVIPVDTINRPVDEGCAYLYGGSWGISWKDIYKTFRQKLCTNRDADWLDLYERSYNFSDDKEKDLVVGYVINALIVQKLEKEKGFTAVESLLACGKYQKGDKNYFAALNKVAGISKQNFNTEVWKLIDQENDK